MFDKVNRFLFNRRAKSFLQNYPREKRFVNYDNAKTILLVFESDYSEKNPRIRRIIRTLASEGKKVMAWGFVDKKEITTAILPDFRILHHKDTDFFGKPLASFMHELEDLHFDLLLDLTMNEVIPLQYISLYSNVYCKTGIKKNELKMYDFIVDISGVNDNDAENPIELDATYIYEQIIFYLKKIQTAD